MTAKTLVSGMAGRLRSTTRFLCWRVLKPQILLDSDAALIRSDSDWEVANEIFVRGEYDESILGAIRGVPAGRPLRILDLGANVGFFALRCIDLYLKQGPPVPLEILAVEGSPRLAGDLEAHFAKPGHDQVKVTVKAGLVGRRSGKAMFHVSQLNSCTNQVSFDNRVSSNPLLNRYAEECQYIDLEALLPPNAPIDLIKCDIEGSELDFLQTYPGLLQRSQVLVIELHPRQCDVPACRELLTSSGFVQQRVIKSLPSHSLEQYRRGAAPYQAE